MSSGWIRCSVLGAPLPSGWKVCFSVVPKAICLTVSVLLDAVALAELELELELEHPAVPSRPAATTVAPSQVAVRRLKVFTRPFVWHLSDARHSGASRAGERSIARRRPRSKNLVNTLKSGQRSARFMDRTAAQGATPKHPAQLASGGRARPPVFRSSIVHWESCGQRRFRLRWLGDVTAGPARLGRQARPGTVGGRPCSSRVRGSIR